MLSSMHFQAINLVDLIFIIFTGSLLWPKMHRIERKNVGSTKVQLRTKVMLCASNSSEKWL